MAQSSARGAALCHLFAFVFGLRALISGKIAFLCHFTEKSRELYLFFLTLQVYTSFEPFLGFECVFVTYRQIVTSLTTAVWRIRAEQKSDECKELKYGV